MIDGMEAIAENVSAIAAMRILHGARTPVFRGSHDDLDMAQVHVLPPFQNMDFSEPEASDQVGNSPGHDDLRRFAGKLPRVSNDLAQRRQIQVVHMRMGEQDRIYRR